MSLCPKKELCGSCGWSHIPYDQQLKQKLADINGSFAIKKVNLVCDTILPSPKTEHYRNRMDFVIDFEGRVGLRQKGKWWRVIDDHSCFIADERIDKLYGLVRAWTQHAGFTFFDRKAHTGLLRYAVIRTTTLGECMVTLITSAPESEDVQQKLEDSLRTLAEELGVTTFIWSVNNTITDVSFGDTLHVMSGPGYITEEIDEVQYRITPNAFFQTNPHGATLLQRTVLDYAGDMKGKKVLDLYCGSGFFSIPLAQRGALVTGVELVPEAIVDAKVNAQLNNVTAQFYDVKTEDYDWTALDPDVLILDPPRSGMHDEVLTQITNALPPRIVYVSCNYKQFAREMTLLSDHYSVEQMTAIDMFPHTPHVELVSLLVKK